VLGPTFDPTKLPLLDCKPSDLGLGSLDARFWQYPASAGSSPLLLMMGLPSVPPGVSLFAFQEDGAKRIYEPGGLLTSAPLVCARPAASVLPLGSFATIYASWVERDAPSQTDTVKFGKIVCQ